MEHGELVAEVRQPPSIIVIVAGVLLVGAGVAFVGTSAVAVAGLGAFGLLAIWAGAYAARRPVRFYEHGVARGGTQLTYEALRIVHDGNLGLRRGSISNAGVMGEIAKLAETDLILGDGRWNGIFRVKRTEVVDRMLGERVLPPAVAAWRARIAAGESYKVPGTVVELKTDELWAPAPRSSNLPILVPLRELQVRGNAAYRKGFPEPVAADVSLARDLLLRALLASHGVEVR